MRSSEQPGRIDSRAVVEEFMPVIRRIARRASYRIGPGSDLDDLVGVGQVGLAQALSRAGNKSERWFRGYAITRIRGAIQDEVRRTDELSRRERVDSKRFAREQSRLRAQLGREPEPQEVASAVGLSADAYKERSERSRRRGEMAIDTVAGTVCPPSELVDVGYLDADQKLDRARQWERVLHSVDRLSPRHKHVLELYYGRGMLLREIADELGVTEPRVSQIHSEAIVGLQRKLGVPQTRRTRNRTRRRPTKTTSMRPARGRRGSSREANGVRI